jgi:hypothetical protein
MSEQEADALTLHVEPPHPAVSAAFLVAFCLLTGAGLSLSLTNLRRARGTWRDLKRGVRR